ncbi:MAG: spore coat associated protein CotJA [Clostridia bacterium]|nr:spore coat associated protein CotJA [Clostridia bacterium]
MEYPKNYTRTNMRSSQMRITAEMSPYSANARASDFEAACSCGVTRQGRNNCKNDCLHGQSLAMVYSPCQEFENLYDTAEALCHGTLFSDLYKPFFGGKK